MKLNEFGQSQNIKHELFCAQYCVLEDYCLHLNVGDCKAICLSSEMQKPNEIYTYLSYGIYIHEPFKTDEEKEYDEYPFTSDGYIRLIPHQIIVDQNLTGWHRIFTYYGTPILYRDEEMKAIKSEQERYNEFLPEKLFIVPSKDLVKKLLKKANKMLKDKLMGKKND